MIEDYLRFFTHAGKTRFSIFRLGKFKQVEPFLAPNGADVTFNTKNSIHWAFILKQMTAATLNLKLFWAIRNRFEQFLVTWAVLSRF